MGRLTPSEADAALPDDVLVELDLPEAGRRYRVTHDGRFLVRTQGTEREQPPMSRRERGAQAVSARGLDRLRSALEGARLGQLPTLLPNAMPEDVTLPGASPLVAQRVVVTARVGDGVARVEARGDPRLPSTLGELERVYTALDEEALGGWARE